MSTVVTHRSAAEQFGLDAPHAGAVQESTVGSTDSARDWAKPKSHKVSPTATTVSGKKKPCTLMTVPPDFSAPYGMPKRFVHASGTIDRGAETWERIGVT